MYNLAVLVIISACSKHWFFTKVLIKVPFSNKQTNTSLNTYHTRAHTRHLRPKIVMSRSCTILFMSVNPILFQSPSEWNFIFQIDSLSPLLKKVIRRNKLGRLDMWLLCCSFRLVWIISYITFVTFYLFQQLLRHHQQPNIPPSSMIFHCDWQTTRQNSNNY